MFFGSAKDPDELPAGKILTYYKIKMKERGQRNEPKRRSPHDHNPEEVPGPRY
jgi:hypothetical protein